MKGNKASIGAVTKMLGLAGGLVALWPGAGAAAPGVTSDVDIRRDATVAAVEAVMPSVVNIKTSVVKRYDDPYEVFFRRFYGLDSNTAPKEEVNSIGSGVIIEESGDEAYILTNLHVVKRADRVQVQLMDGRVYDAQRLLGTTQKDLALLRIVRQKNEPPFQPVRIAKDEDLLLGETVIAVGNPFGLGGSVSRGILSAKTRRTNISNDTTLSLADWLQTDADINPGNSGGPLVNLRGELIGINVALYNEGEGAKGTGFAIPAKQISATLSDFFTPELKSSLWLGARLRGKPYALTVLEVDANSPAERAGFKAGQQVTEVNGQPVSGLAEFNKLVASSAAKVKFTVLDNGVRRTLEAELVTLRELNRSLLQKRLGIVAQPLTEQQATTYKLSPTGGLLVSEVEKGGPAELIQMQPGLVLTAVDGNPVNDLPNVVNALSRKPAGENVRLDVILPRRYASGAVQLLPLQATVPLR